ncbi:SDR family oxidoreductase [Streptomyces tanashiensis]
MRSPPRWISAAGAASSTSAGSTPASGGLGSPLTAPPRPVRSAPPARWPGNLAPHRIRVNTVVPGAIQVAAENNLPARYRARPDDQIARQCVPRRGPPEDVAAAVAYLAGPSASFITGKSLHIDDGRQLH